MLRKSIGLYCILKGEKKFFLNPQELLVGMKEKKKEKLDNGEFFPLVSPNTEMKYFSIIKEKSKISIYHSPHHVIISCTRLFSQ